MACKNIKGGVILTCACGHCFSLLCQRWHWWQELWVGSVGRDIFDPVEGELCNSKK